MHERTGHIRSTWVDTGRYRLHARVSTDPVPPGRPPVVLVHGLAVSSLYFVPSALHLAPHFRVYAPDLPGFGRSPKPHHVLNIQELANVLVAYIRRMDLGRPVLVANSLGCQIVVDLALRYPEHVDRAVLIGPTMDPRARTALQQCARLLLDSVHEPCPQPLVVGFDYLRCGVRRTLRTLRYGLEDPIEDKAPFVQAPMIVVRGEYDSIVPRRWAAEMAARLPGGRLIEVPGAAHTVNFGAPAALTRIVRDFTGC